MDFRLRTLNSPGPGARLAAEKAGATWPPPGQGEGGNVILAIFVLLVVFLLCSPQLCYPVSPTSFSVLHLLSPHMDYSRTPQTQECTDSDFNGGAHFNATEVVATVEHGMGE